MLRLDVASEIELGRNVVFLKKLNATFRFNLFRAEPFPATATAVSSMILTARFSSNSNSNFRKVFERKWPLKQKYRSFVELLLLLLFESAAIFDEKYVSFVFEIVQHGE